MNKKTKKKKNKNILTFYYIDEQGKKKKINLKNGLKNIFRDFLNYLIMDFFCNAKNIVNLNMLDCIYAF